jgi:hypothetical protein
MVDTSADAAQQGWARWQRRLIEALVALLAFAVWGKLAYIGGFRLLARAEGLTLSGHWILDAASLFIGVSGSIAGVSAMWALGMRIAGKTPKSLVGAPDDAPEDYPTYMRTADQSMEQSVDETLEHSTEE